MKKFKKFTVLILTAVVLSLCLAVFTACDQETVPQDEKVYKKNAILMVTALTSGGLYDSKLLEGGATPQEAAVWDPLGADASFEQALYGDMVGLVVGAILNQTSLDKVLSVLKYGTEEELAANYLWQLIMDENGESHNPNLVPANDPYSDGKIEYGALAAYRTSCLAMRDWLDSVQYTEGGESHTLGDEWDVDVFNYDWRIDNRKNSELLEEYIREHYPDPDGKVILTSHSMGGPVVAGYLARSKANRDRVLAYIPNSPAFYGSVSALMFLDDPVGTIYDMVKGMGIDLQSLGIADEALQKLAVPLVQNMTSAMQLLPFPQFVDSEWYYDEVLPGETVPEGVKQYVREDGKYEEAKDPQIANGKIKKYLKTSCVKIRSKDAAECYMPSDKLYDFYCSRPWAKKADGTLKPGMKDLDIYWKSMTVDTDNDGTEDTFAPELVDTYYLLGTGLATVKTLVFDSETAGTYDHAAIVYGDGDGTMPLSACLGGLSLEHIKNGEKSHYHVFERGGHGNVGADWEMTGETHVEILRKVLTGKYGALTDKAA